MTARFSSAYELCIFLSMHLFLDVYYRWTICIIEELRQSVVILISPLSISSYLYKLKTKTILNFFHLWILKRRDKLYYLAVFYFRSIERVIWIK